MPGMWFRRFSRVFLAGAATGMAGPALAATVHFSDFQGAVGSEWSRTDVDSAPNPDFDGNRKFLGQFGDETVSLGLDGLPAHDSIRLSFELFVIRSWDGNDTSVVNGDPLGPDRWSVGFRDQASFFSETFSNGNPAGQSFHGSASTFTDTAYTPCSGVATGPGPHAPMTGANECFSLGFEFDDKSEGDPEDGPEVMDAVFNLAFDLDHSGDSLTLDFVGAEGLQGLDDESWGLDNVRVETSVVPIPGALVLFASGVLAVLGGGIRGRR